MIWGWEIVKVVLTVVGWLIPGAMLFIVPVNRKPTAALAWLLLLVLVPYFGLLLFLLLGSPKLSRRRLARQQAVGEVIRKTLVEERSHPTLAELVTPPIPAPYEQLERLGTHLGEMPACAGNAVELLPDYHEVFRRLITDIDQAQHSVHVEFYAMCRDAETEGVFASLERAHQRGVLVRVLLDHLGSRHYPHFKAMCRRLQAEGIELHLLLPLHLFGANYTRPDLRNHRKLVVIDGSIGYTGSQNLISQQYGRKDQLSYKEVMVRVQGPITRQLQTVYVSDWCAETGVLLTAQSAPEIASPLQAAGTTLCQVVPSGPGFPDENVRKLFTALAYLAQQRLVITTPYFVPDEAVLTAITSAAQRGVEVTLVNSEAADQPLVHYGQCSYYEALLSAGVKVYRYPAPTLLHAKHLSIDNAIAVIGSSNLDMRSFQLNLEVILVCFDQQVVADLRHIEDAYLRKAKRVTLDAWSARPLKQRLLENLSRLTTPLQ
jgi:cardiolipin synthase